MPVNPLPPQAYTKETLQKAYAWLLTQNTSVKEMAHDQNILVSMYLKAQRNGDAALETPSIQNFKQELKSLASMMGDFQPPLTASHAAQVPQTTPTTTITTTSQQTVTATTTAPIATTASPIANFDARTLAAIAEVRETFNLSSDAEAIRALVSIGIKQFKKLNLNG